MSFFKTESGVLCRELWPNGLGIIDLDDCAPEDEDSFVMEDQFKVVPSTFEGICEWAFVAAIPQSADWTRTYLTLYKQPDCAHDPAVIYPVSLRLQGKIKTFNLSTFGSWNGAPHNAVKARQFIALESGGFEEPWGAMQKSIRDIRQMIHNTLSRGIARREEIIPELQQDIYLSRRVFEKIRDRNSIPPPPNVADDPEGWFYRIAGSWSVSDRIEVGKRMENGDIVACSPLVLSVGDFVDVTATIDISYRGDSGVSVHLAFNRVVRLATAGEIPSTSTPSAPSQCSVPIYRQVVRSGFALKQSV